MNNLLEKFADHLSNLTARQAAYWAAALTVLVLVVSAVSTYVDIRNDGNEQELGMVFQWNTMQARYSQGRLSVVDGLKIADNEKDALVQLLKTGVGQRSAFTDANDRLDRNKFISVVHEAYPQLGGLNIYDRLFVEVQAMRTVFAADQGKLHDMVRAYDLWRTTGGLFQPLLVEWIGFPSKRLEIRIGQKVLTGPEALDKLSRAIISTSVQEIFESGKDRPITR